MLVESKAEKKTLSRRDILVVAGKLAVGAAGIAVVSSGGLNLLSNAEAKEKPISKAEAVKKPTFPWEYQKLDLGRVGDLAYGKWFEVFCCQGVVTGLFEQLQEKIGEPYTSFPIPALRFGMGGMLGWGVTCGSLIGGSLLIGLTVPKDHAERMINDLVKWYSTTMLPTFKPTTPKTTIKDKEGKERKFKGDFKNLTKSNSPLCHQSVGRWMKKEGAGADWDSDRRKNRCAMITGSVAVKTAEILNGWIDSGKYVPVNEPQTKVRPIPFRKDIKIAAQDNCGDCHNPISVGWRAIKSRLF